MTTKFFFSLYFALFFYSFSIAQISIPFNSPQWDIQGSYKLEDYKGKYSLVLTGTSAHLKDLTFKNGIIEYDVAFGTDRGFAGVQFRIQDKRNYEEYYMRPHQSGNPDAMQYTPVFNGLGGWQLYYGDGYGTTYVYKFNEWMHVKLIINNHQMEVYIDDMSQPVLYAFDLKRKTAPGTLGLYSNLAEIHFANFSFEPLENPVLVNSPKKLPPIPAGTINSWNISDAFHHSDINDILKLNSNHISARKWTPMHVEYSGTANLAQMNTRTTESNTVYAKCTVIANEDLIKAIEFGYSDEVKVFVNGGIFYGGHTKYRSRDYRYLGTIGYFETLYVPLKEGKNELYFAITENFGGWGIQARFPDMEGISLE